MPEYNHTFKTANYARILNDLKEQKQGIVTGIFITPERQEYIHYSEIPAYLVLPNALITRKTDLKKFTPFLSDNGLLGIEPLILSENIVIGFSKGRSYSGIFDQMIKNIRIKVSFMKDPDRTYLQVC